MTSIEDQDITMASVAVTASSGGSKRHRSPFSDAAPRKRHQSGKSEGEDHHPIPDNALQPVHTTPPTGVDGLIWAFKRQPLCDSQAYFRSHQGGTYTKNKVIQGLLVAGSVEIRDFLGKDTMVTCW